MINNSLGQTFCGVLGYDALEAMIKMEANESQPARRDFVRTAFAAIEGWLWLYRQNIQEMVASIRGLTPLERSAFEEKSFGINETGQLKEQERFVPLTAMFRFVVKLAEKEFGERLIDFSSADWQNFNHAIRIRNRITHPKTIEDLNLSKQDIELVRGALLWAFANVVTGSEQAQLALTNHIGSMREVLDSLATGNAETMALYKAVLNSDS
ncbi:MAG: hypothetical protein ACKVOS_01075 [Sphingorhabdus sp.]|uniref:hypothetical protein n=1 Tax=Sphingorhabdus sp. TaxID=1902408 RepID=UPI0038FC6C36